MTNVIYNKKVNIKLVTFDWNAYYIFRNGKISKDYYKSRWPSGSYKENLNVEDSIDPKATQIFLKNIDCSYWKELKKKNLCMGTLSIIQELINNKNQNLKRKIKIIGYTLIKTDSYKSFYHNNKAPGKDHNHSIDMDIILWLHNNNFVDATYCFINKIEDEIILDTKGLITLKQDTISELKEVYPNLVIKY